MATSENQNQSVIQVGQKQHEDDRANVSNADKTIISTQNKSTPAVKEPLKLLIQMTYYFIIFIPLTFWAILSHFFTSKKSIRNNVVMITGTGRGLGRSLALKFAELDCSIACVDIDMTNNTETVELIKKKYPSVKTIAYKCNIALVDDIKCLAKNISNDLGEVDIVVNNAGIVSGAGFTKLGIEYLDIMLDVNLKSHFLIIEEFLPKMIRRNSGHIVAIASLAGLNGLSKASVYSATKHGVIGLMESLYDELRAIPDNKIQTTCICPYFIATNELYAKYWDLRIPELSMEEVTEATVDAVMRNKRIVSIPSHLYYFSIIFKIIPDILKNILKKIVYVRLNLPEKELGINIDAIIKDAVTRRLEIVQTAETDKLKSNNQ